MSNDSGAFLDNVELDDLLALVEQAPGEVFDGHFPHSTTDQPPSTVTGELAFTTVLEPGTIDPAYLHEATPELASSAAVMPTHDDQFSAIEVPRMTAATIADIESFLMRHEIASAPVWVPHLLPHPEPIVLPRPIPEYIVAKHGLPRLLPRKRAREENIVPRHSLNLDQVAGAPATLSLPSQVAMQQGGNGRSSVAKNALPPVKKQKRELRKVVGRCPAGSHMCYAQPTMPEQSKGGPKHMWVVFYCAHVHSPAHAKLILQPATTKCKTLEFNPELELSWSTCAMVNGAAVVQHKWCFTSPESTFSREIFQASLLFTDSVYDQTDTGGAQYEEPSVELGRRMMAMALGPVSFVSTTSQRKDFWPRMESRCANDQQRQLIVNFREHNASRRHFLNGKGVGQQVRADPKEWFRFEEYAKAAPLDTVPL